MTLTKEEHDNLLSVFRARFEKNMHRHSAMEWAEIENRLLIQPKKCWSLFEMERTGGEPDVIHYDQTTDQYWIVDCVKESPAGRRSVCYDPKALEDRKEYKPAHSAVGMANEMGITLLTAEQYKILQDFGPVDTKTSSWIHTPDKIRKLDGGLFGDYRYGTVFTYHNGASSYYAARGFRGLLLI
jgi:hypothetical protein